MNLQDTVAMIILMVLLVVLLVGAFHFWMQKSTVTNNKQAMVAHTTPKEVVPAGKDNPFELPLQQYHAAALTRALVSSTNEFSIMLLRAMPPLVASPASVVAVLTTLYAGVKPYSETQRQLKRALNFYNEHVWQQIDSSQLMIFLQRWQNHLVHTGVEINNVLFLNDRWQLQPRFEQHALIQSCFAVLRGPGDAHDERRLNDWAAKHTHGKNSQLLPPNTLDRDTALVLINTISFKSNWKVAFDKDLSHKRPFISCDGRSRLQTMMRMQDKRHYYFDGGNFQLLELMYANEAVRFGVFLPDYARGVDTHNVCKFAAHSLQPAIESLRWLEVGELQLPRFKQRHRMELTSFLKALGAKRLFDSVRGAELDQIIVLPASAASPQQNNVVFVSDVIHEAVIAVDETGTEAAAATAVVVQATNMTLPPSGQHRIRFVADHSFVFYLRHVPTNTMLFVGFYD